MPAEHRTGDGWRALRTCPICWTAFAPTQPTHTYCSQRCRKAGHVRRHAAPDTTRGQDAATSARPAPVTVRACPHCGGEVSIVALLTTPEAARPTLPEPGVVPLRRA